MSLEKAFELFDAGKEEAMEWLKHELVGIRTGRVTPEAVANVAVEHYGTRTPLKGLASVSNSDARTLIVTPWDPSAIHAVEKALTNADVGTRPIADKNVLRLVFPALTEEIRERTVKTLHKKAEEARVRMRLVRDEALSLLRKEKEASAITEDDFYDGRKGLDERIETANKELETIITAKEKDVRAV